MLAQRCLAGAFPPVFVVNACKVSCELPLLQTFHVRNRIKHILAEHNAQRQKALASYKTGEIEAEDEEKEDEDKSPMVGAPSI